MLWCSTKTLSANPYHVLGLPSKKSNGLHYSLQELRTAFYAKAKEVHPDAGGSAEQFRELRQAYDVVRSECTQNFAATNGNNNHYYNNNVNSMYANKGFYNHPHAQWSRAQYKSKEERENNYDNSNEHYEYQYDYWSKPESEWMKRYAQKCKNDNERFYAKQRDAQQQRMEKEWQDYKTAWNDLNSQDYKSSKNRRRRQQRENKEYCYNEEYEQWFRSAPQYANYSSWYFYRPYTSHMNEESCRSQYKNSQNTANNEFDSSNNRREFYQNLEREWAEAQLRRKKRYSYYYNERQESSWIQLLVKWIVLCIGAATVYYSYNKQKEFATLQKEEKEQRRREYMYNYYQLRNTHKQEVEHKGQHTTSNSMNDHNIDSERMRRLERYRSSPETVPHVVRYQGRPFTPDGVRAGKNVAVKTAATFEADKTYELEDEDVNDDEGKDNNKHLVLENRKQEDKSGLLSRGDNDNNNNKSNRATVKVAN